MSKTLTEDIIPSLKGKVENAVTSSTANLVPQTRTVNGKALSENIILTPSDVSAVPASDFSLTAAEQTNVKNLPTAVVTNINQQVSSTATQAKMGIASTNLSTGSSSDGTANLPMASSNFAGCVTAADKQLIDDIPNKQNKVYAAQDYKKSEQMGGDFIDIPVEFTVPDTSPHLLALGLSLDSASGNLNNVPISINFTKSDGSAAGSTTTTVPLIREGYSNDHTVVLLRSFSTTQISLPIHLRVYSTNKNLIITGYQKVMLI